MVSSNKMPRYLIKGKGVSVWLLSLIHRLILSLCLGFLKISSALFYGDLLVWLRAKTLDVLGQDLLIFGILG